jgi:pimeloyl-ACP methyl ester carboxylesterase
MSRTELPAEVVAWRERGESFAFRDNSIHTFHRDGDGTPIVLLHGFPTSSFDWAAAIEKIGPNPVLAFDFLGFGLSDKPREHSYTLAWQADLTEALVREKFGDRPVFICAHDMGTSVATELMARDIEGELGFEIAGILLFNGSILVDRANPTLAQKLLRGPLGPVTARLANEPFFRRQFSSIFSEGHPASPGFLSDCWELMELNGGNRLGHKLISYMEERQIYAERWHGAIRSWGGELSLLWGMQDPVAVPEILEGLLELRPSVDPVRFEDLGHYPQVEDPERFVSALTEILASCDGYRPIDIGGSPTA